MKMYRITALLLAISGSIPVPANAEFSPAQKVVWEDYCASELNGDRVYCDCMLKTLVSEIGEEGVGVNLDNLMVDSPSVGEADKKAAAKRMDAISTEVFVDNMLDFGLILKFDSEQCLGD